MGKHSKVLELESIEQAHAERTTAADIAGECERRAQLHRAEAERLEHAAFVLRGVLELPGSAATRWR